MTYARRVLRSPVARLLLPLLALGVGCEPSEFARVDASEGAAASTAPLGPVTLAADPDPTPERRAAVERDDVDPRRDVPAKEPAAEPLVPKVPSDAQFAAWMLDLCDDAERWNAARAKSNLRAHWPASRPWLEAGLESADHQQRQLSANILAGARAEPTDALVRVLVEGLRDDGLPVGTRFDGGRSYTAVYNADRGEHFLARHMDAARVQVQAAFDTSDDPQQRMRCASLLGSDDRNPYRLDLVPFLVECLRDNDVVGDAARATAVIVRMGQLGVPALIPLADGSSRQDARLAAAILERLGPHPPGAEELCARYDLLDIVNGSQF